MPPAPKLLTGHEYFRTECEYHAAKKATPFIFGDQSPFFRTLLLHCKQTRHAILKFVPNGRRVSRNNNNKRALLLLFIKTPIFMATFRKSITDQLVQLGSCCSVLSHEVLASAKMLQRGEAFPLSTQNYRIVLSKHVF